MGFGSRAATVLLLIAGGVVALLFAIRLTAAALGWEYSPFDALPLPVDHGLRAFWLLVVVAVLAVLVWLVVRHDEPMLWLTTPDGGVAVPASALEQLAVLEAQADEEVVSAEADLRVARGALKADLRVFGRPFGDAARVRDEAVARVRAGLVAASGLDDVRVKVRARILAVRQLPRYLP